ncbi:TolC family protein [Bacteroidales bacterium]|nr:TolC family protein [Bacteroidales bacterium]
MSWIKYIIPFICISALAQEEALLTLSDAVKITLENDFDIQIIENNVEISKNNATRMANGYLPIVTGTAGLSGNTADADYTLLSDGTTGSYNTESQSLNAGVALNYTLFDGMQRAYNYQKSQKLLNLSKIQAEQVIEGTLLRLFNTYYNVAALSENVNVQVQTLNISKDRLLRVKTKADYGQITQLEVLNAQVDVNNDSINLLNTIQQLNNTKRDLNLLLQRKLEYAFTVDTSLIFNLNNPVDTLVSQAIAYNKQVKISEQNNVISDYNVKISKTGYLPKVNLSSSYGYNKQDANYGQYETQSSLGLSAQLGLSWNLFDGGRTHVATQNAKVQVLNSQLSYQQLLLQVKRDVTNAYTSFQNAIFVLEAEQTNLITGLRNFERSKEQYELGQITALEFRQAQQNLLFAKTKYNAAKYSAKIYELSVHQLTGKLLEQKF